jgi:hypothetical protein
MTILTIPEDEEQNTITEEEFLGIVYSVKKTEKGFTFSFEDTEGNNFRCFSYNEPDNNEAYRISGDFSSDGKMFFIDKMRSLNNE